MISASLQCSSVDPPVAPEAALIAAAINYSRCSAKQVLCLKLLIQDQAWNREARDLLDDSKPCVRQQPPGQGSAKEQQLLAETR